MEPVVTLKNISKTFKIKANSSRTIREFVLYSWRKKQTKKKVKVLDNVNFEVKKGEIFGVIGRNGSGKSTLLHIVLGNLRPDSGGVVKTEGRVFRLALGMGFDGNLTTRENIYVNGSILGLSFRFIGQKFHEILRFAELEQYADRPIKQMSNGMKARLSFAIAMYAETDILLIDEFFGAVGDERFKKKSKKAFRSSFIKDKTIIIVSHNMKEIRELCDRVLLLEDGKPVMIGEPGEVIQRYTEN